VCSSELGNTSVIKYSTSRPDDFGWIHGSCESLHVSCIHPKVYVLGVDSGGSSSMKMYYSCNILSYLLFYRNCWSHCPIVFEFIIDGAGGVCCTTLDYVLLCKHGAPSGEDW